MRNSLLGPALAPLLTLFIVFGSACGRAPDERAPDGMGGSSPDPMMPTSGSPPAAAAPVAQASYGGVYALTTPLDFTQNGVLPGLVGPALLSLSQVHDRPGTALLALAEAANVPYLSDILQKVPSFLQGVLAGVLNTVITDAVYQGNPVLDQVAAMVQGVAGLANHLTVQTMLTLTTAPPAAGAASAKLAVTAVEFESQGQTQLAAVPMAALAAATLSGPAHITPHSDAPVADADLQLAGGTLTLPIGDLILNAAGELIFSPFGGATDLAGALGALVPCDEVAADLVDQLDGYLTLEDARHLCTGALAALADQVSSQLSQVTLAVTIGSATAELLDAAPGSPVRDHQADQVVRGAWSWQFAVGGGQVELPATFEGARIRQNSQTP